MTLWLLALHIIAMLFWAAALLYLPALVHGVDARRTDIASGPARQASVARFVCTHVATPAALLAIITGTAVFLVDRNAEPWLLAKLTLVTGLVIGHTLMGLLVLRAERESGPHLRRYCMLLGGVLCLLIGGIVWLVLAKPGLGALT